MFEGTAFCLTSCCHFYVLLVSIKQHLKGQANPEDICGFQEFEASRFEKFGT